MALKLDMGIEGPTMSLLPGLFLVGEVTRPSSNLLFRSLTLSWRAPWSLSSLSSLCLISSTSSSMSDFSPVEPFTWSPPFTAATSSASGAASSAASSSLVSSSAASSSAAASSTWRMSHFSFQPTLKNDFNFENLASDCYASWILK